MLIKRSAVKWENYKMKNESKHGPQKAQKLLVHPENYFTKKHKILKVLLLFYFIQMNNNNCSRMEHRYSCCHDDASH